MEIKLFFVVFSLRAQFAVEGSKINPLHGSDTVESAEKELEFFFPMQQTVAVIKPDAYQTKGMLNLPMLRLISSNAQKGKKN